MRVLVVDDDKLVAVSLKTILEADGEITVVGLGEAGDDAIRLYREQHPDILLMDIRMPVMDGLESARRIRTSGHPDARTIPIIALTANAFDEDTKKSLASGMNGHLSKPIQVDQMLEVMGRCMGLIS